VCGICGKYSLAGVRQEELGAMLHTIAHRGPDDEGFYLNGPIGLGSRRLSIIDLPGGHQPICNEDETVWIVYNGEIYNYKILRHDLEKKGHIFKTYSDTEVIVHLYEEFDERCVDQLDGMFSFAIWDNKQKKLILARDRIGQKPLFYSHNQDSFIFASEIKAILVSDGFQCEIDFESIHHYLSLRFIPSPGTMLRSIKKLPPAHILVWQNGRIALSRYWQLSFRQKLNVSETELSDNLEEKLDQTIESHLVSDVPVGAFLSGGMDSSLIVALMARNLEATFKTFVIGVDDQSYNEFPYARTVADYYKTEHFEQKVQADIIDLLPKMIWHLDEPSDPIAACQFHAAELAARHVKVVLGGDGGDELFGGFDRYLGVRLIDYLTWLPFFIRSGIIGSILNLIPETYNYKSLTQKLRWIHELSLLPDIGERYAEATCVFRFNEQKKQKLYSGELKEKFRHLNSADVIVSQFNKGEADDVIDKMLYADIMTRLPEHSLMLTDRMTMAHSLEARSPFLDHRLVELLAAFPGNLKIRGRRLKYILRKIGEKNLPATIVKRKKQGFMLPVAFWFRNELYTFIKSFLLDSYFVREGLFRKEIILNLIEEHRNNRVDNHVRLWMLLNLEIWHQIYIQQLGLSTVSKKLEHHLHQ
jgi:asparagine synthase (glutamine-hydrolysing)